MWHLTHNQLVVRAGDVVLVLGSGILAVVALDYRVWIGLWPAVPIMAAAMCASGARSPLAPTEPCAGTMGIASRPIIASSMATVLG